MRSVEERLRAANPVPDPGRAMDDAIYAQVLRNVMKSDVTPGRDENRQSQVARLVAGCLILVLAVGAGFVWGRDHDNTTIVTKPSPVQLATFYIEARNNHNAKAALALLAPEAMVIEYPVVRGVSELDAAFDFLDLVDERFTTFSCETPVDEPGVATCSYEMSNLLVEKSTAGPVTGKMRFIVDDGEILSIENTIDFDLYESRVLDLWFTWLDKQSPGGMRALYRWAFLLDQSVPSPRLDNIEALREPVSRYTESE